VVTNVGIRFSVPRWTPGLHDHRQASVPFHCILTRSFLSPVAAVRSPAEDARVVLGGCSDSSHVSLVARSRSNNTTAVPLSILPMLRDVELHFSALYQCATERCRTALHVCPAPERVLRSGMTRSPFFFFFHPGFNGASFTHGFVPHYARFALSRGQALQGRGCRLERRGSQLIWHPPDRMTIVDSGVRHERAR